MQLVNNMLKCHLGHCHRIHQKWINVTIGEPGVECGGMPRLGIRLRGKEAAKNQYFKQMEKWVKETTGMKRFCVNNHQCVVGIYSVGLGTGRLGLISLLGHEAHWVTLGSVSISYPKEPGCMEQQTLPP